MLSGTYYSTMFSCTGETWWNCRHIVSVLRKAEAEKTLIEVWDKAVLITYEPQSSSISISHPKCLQKHILLCWSDVIQHCCYELGALLFPVSKTKQHITQEHKCLLDRCILFVFYLFETKGNTTALFSVFSGHAAPILKSICVHLLHRQLGFIQGLSF